MASGAFERISEHGDSSELSFVAVRRFLDSKSLWLSCALFLSRWLLGLFESCQLPEVVGEHGPSEHGFAVLKAFRQRRCSHELANEDTHACFGSCAALETFS